MLWRKKQMEKDVQVFNETNIDIKNEQWESQYKKQANKKVGDKIYSTRVFNKHRKLDFDRKWKYQAKHQASLDSSSFLVIE